MHRKKTSFSGKHKVNHNSNNQGENVSFINARRTPQSKFNHQWNDVNKQKFSKFTNSSNTNKPDSFNSSNKSNNFNINKSYNFNSSNKPNNFNSSNKFNNSNSTKSNNFNMTKQNNFNTNKPNKIDDFISKIDFTNIEKIITAILEQFRANDLDRLHRIDEKALEESIVSYRKDIAELTIIAYSFRKLLSKKHIFNSPNWKGFREKTISNLEEAIKLSKEENKDNYNLKIKEIQNSIEKTDQLLGHFIHDIVFNARTKLASSAYAYGLSLSQASNLLSANKDLVMELVGQTKIPDEDIKTKTMTERVNFLKTNIPENKEKKVQKK